MTPEVSMTPEKLTDEPAKVHVVMGAAGEYSDRREWPIKAYLDLAAAQAHVEAATAYLKQNLPDGYISYEEREAFTKNNPFDPGGDLECYSGADYFLYSVEIEGAAAERTRADTLERERDGLKADMHDAIHDPVVAWVEKQNAAREASASDDFTRGVNEGIRRAEAYLMIAAVQTRSDDWSRAILGLVESIAELQPDQTLLYRSVDAEHTARIAAEERVSALTVERDALRDALMVQTRRANGCVAGCACLDGGVGWGAKGCVCADDCSRMAATFSAPPAGGEKL